MASVKKKTLKPVKPAGSAGKKKKKKKKSRIGRFIRGCGRIMHSFYRLGSGSFQYDFKGKYSIFGVKINYKRFIIFTVLLTLFVYALLTNNSVGLDKESIIITGLSNDFEGYNILFITDLNSRWFGDDQQTLMREMTNEKWNLVIFGGDMVGPGGNTAAFYSLLEQIGTKKPVYFIAGDSDPSPILTEPRDNSAATMTLNEMVYADWVLGAMERGAVYLDTPVSIKKGSSTLWLFPDTYLNINVNEEYNEFKDEVNQESESYLEGIERAKTTLPLTTYRRNLLHKASDLISSVKSEDLIIMVSHEAPTEDQLLSAQASLSEEDAKNYFIGPDLVLCGHYCGGEWRIPLIGAIHVSSSILPNYGWFPNQKYVMGQYEVGNTMVYTSPGLSSNSQTYMWRLFNPPRASLLTLTGELPSSFLD